MEGFKNWWAKKEFPLLRYYKERLNGTHKEYLGGLSYSQLREYSSGGANAWLGYLGLAIGSGATKVVSSEYTDAVPFGIGEKIRAGAWGLVGLFTGLALLFTGGAYSRELERRADEAGVSVEKLISYESMQTLSIVDINKVREVQGLLPLEK